MPFASCVQGKEAFFGCLWSLPRDWLWWFTPRKRGLFCGSKKADSGHYVGIADPVHPHACVPLYGRFKNEANEAMSLVIVANASKHGLPMRPCY